MTKEIRKRLEEAAEMTLMSVKTDCYLRMDGMTESAYKDGFMDGGEWMFNECGGMTVLHDMRRMILAQCKEWLKQNAQPKYIFIEDGHPWIDNAQLLHDFESDMNKLWEEKK